MHAPLSLLHDLKVCVSEIQGESENLNLIFVLIETKVRNYL